jgi:hypothetical protein
VSGDGPDSRLYPLLVRVAEEQGSQREKLDAILQQLSVHHVRILSLELYVTQKQTEEKVQAAAKERTEKQHEKAPVKRLVWLVPPAVLSAVAGVLVKLLS